MSDKLKKYVEERSADFEVFPFDVEEGWKGVAERVSKPEPKKQNPWMKIAASVSLLLVASIVLLIFQYQQNTGLARELAEAEYYYQEMVDAKLASVKGKVDTAPILADFEVKDDAFRELKNDLNDNVDNHEVVEAMIANYRLKLKILEQIVTELEEDNYESIETSI